MKTEIIAIGDELLIGQVVDTNSSWIAQFLSKNNIKVNRVNIIGDIEEQILNEFGKAFKRSDLIIITGGLGPTKDDLTKGLLAKFFNMKMRQDETVLEMLKEFFAKRGREILDTNIEQSYVPEGCKTLININGTAPGMLFEKDGKIMISMPGVPDEMKEIFENQAFPLIKEKFQTPKIIHQTMVVANVPESILAKRIAQVEDSLPKYIKLAYLPNQFIVRLRLTGTQIANKLNLQDEINEYQNKIAEILGENIIAFGDYSLEEIILKILVEKGKTLSIAESCTGGFLSHLITSLAGASKVYVGSVTSYSNSVKHHQLGVENTLFETVGAVSEQVVNQMAIGVRERLLTDFSIAVSGIAGPDGGSEDKPVGTVIIGVSCKEETLVKKFNFKGNRQQIIKRTAMVALFELRNLILKH